MIYKSPAIIMACPDRPGINTQGLPECIIAKMGRIENDPQFIHFFKKLNATCTQSATRIRPIRVAPGPIMRRAKSPESITISLFQVGNIHNRISSLQTKYISDMLINL